MAQTRDTVAANLRPYFASRATSCSPFQTLETKARRVYVGNLAWRVRWQDLKDYMKSAGQVVRADVFEDRRGQSRGCGIVEYATEEEAQRAIETLCDTVLFDRKIFVREDREDDSGFRGGMRGGDGYRGEASQNYNYSASSSPPRSMVTTEPNDCLIFVGNLPWKTTQEDLIALFSKTGEVAQAEIYSWDGRSKGCGTVLFKSPEIARQAVSDFHDIEYEGRPLLVRLDQGRRQRA